MGECRVWERHVHVLLCCPQSEKGVKQTLQWLRPGLFLADTGCNTCPMSDALVIQCWENVLSFFFCLEEKCCFCYSSQQVYFQVLHEISRASPSQPMQPMICSWPLWGEVIRRKFLFSCICFPTQPCCFINFTGLDMCFKSDLRYVRKSSHSTDLSKHCWLTGTRSFPLHAGLQKQADVCAQQPHAPGGGAAQSPSCLQSSVKNNNKIEMLLSALKSTSRLLLIKK